MKIECSICFEEYQKGDLELHRKTCVVRLVFRCTLCDGHYMNLEGLWNHMDLHGIADENKELHCQELKAKHKLHQCTLCNDQRAYSESHYWDHIQDVHDGFFLRCSECGEKFKSEKLKTDHACQNCNVKARTATSTCQKTAASAVEVIDIKMEISVEETTLASFDNLGSLMGSSSSVTECKRELTERKDLDVTSGSSSGDDGSGKQCPHCEKKLPTKVTLYTHVLNCHVPAKCGVCGITFPNRCAAKYHKEKEHMKMRFKCPHCSRPLKTELVLKNHAAVCQHRKHRCDFCGLMFKTRHSVNYHKKHFCHGSEISKTVPESNPSTGNNNNEHNSILRRETMSDNPDKPESAYGIEKGPNSPTADKELLETKCTDCNKKFPNPVSFYRHVTNYHEPLKCNICDVIARGYQGLKQHKITCHSAPSHECPTCGKKIDRIGRFQSHLVVCARRKYPCEICGRRFIHLSTLNQHIRRDHQNGGVLSNIVAIDQKHRPVQDNHLTAGTSVEEPSLSTYENANDQVACSTEQTQIKSDPEKTTQSLSEHSSMTFKCPICDVVSPNFAQAKYHKQLKHAESKHQCPHCLTIIRDTKNFDTHTRVCATRKESCKLCGYRLKTKEGILDHMIRVHNVRETSSNVSSGDAEQQNSVIAKATASSENSITDYDEKNSSPNQAENKAQVEISSIGLLCTKCPYCEKDYSNGGFLPRHIELCHVPCRCDICGLTFTSALKRNYHVNTTHKESKYKCPHCPQKFQQNDPFEKHLSLCQSKRYCCETCGKRYKRHRKFIIHKKTVHPDQNVSEKTDSLDKKTTVGEDTELMGQELTCPQQSNTKQQLKIESQ